MLGAGFVFLWSTLYGIWCFVVLDQTRDADGQCSNVWALLLTSSILSVSFGIYTFCVSYWKEGLVYTQMFLNCCGTVPLLIMLVWSLFIYTEISSSCQSYYEDEFSSLWNLFQINTIYLFAIISITWCCAYRVTRDDYIERIGDW